MSNQIDSHGPYGYCPTCNEAGVKRERRMGGNDTCVNGHTYPTASAVQLLPEATRRAMEEELQRAKATVLPEPTQLTRRQFRVNQKVNVQIKNGEWREGYITKIETDSDSPGVVRVHIQAGILDVVADSNDNRIVPIEDDTAPFQVGDLVKLTRVEGRSFATHVKAVEALPVIQDGEAYTHRIRFTNESGSEDSLLVPDPQFVERVTEPTAKPKPVNPFPVGMKVKVRRNGQWVPGVVIQSQPGHGQVRVEVQDGPDSISAWWFKTNRGNVEPTLEPKPEPERYDRRGEEEDEEERKPGTPKPKLEPVEDEDVPAPKKPKAEPEKIEVMEDEDSEPEEETDETPAEVSQYYRDKANTFKAQLTRMTGAKEAAEKTITDIHLQLSGVLRDATTSTNYKQMIDHIKSHIAKLTVQAEESKQHQMENQLLIEILKATGVPTFIAPAKTSEEAYQDSVKMSMLAATMLSKCKVPEMLEAINLANAVGAIIDPTSWTKNSTKMMQDKELLEAALPLHTIGSRNTKQNN